MRDKFKMRLAAIVAVIFLGGVLCALYGKAGIFSRKSHDNAPDNIVVFIFDCLRYDAVDLADMKNLKEYSDGGVLFRCVAGGNRTFDGFNTILTGKYLNQIILNEDFTTSDKEILLPEIMKSEGWTTVFISSCVGDSGFAIHNWLQGSDYSESYEGYSTDPWYLKGESYRTIVRNKLDECFAEQASSRKLIVLHIAEPHEPYEGAGNSDREMYYNACRDGDESLKACFDLLGEYGVNTSNTVYFVTSDHGQQLLEYGSFGHGYTLNDEETIVPMAVFGKGIPALGERDRTVSHVDLLPAVMEICNIDLKRIYCGEDFLSVLEDAGQKTRVIYTMNYNVPARGFDIRSIEVNY